MGLLDYGGGQCAVGVVGFGASGGGGLAQGFGVGLLAAPNGLSPLCLGLESLKIHQAVVLAHRFCFSMVVGRGTNTLRMGGGLSREC